MRFFIFWVAILFSFSVLAEPDNSVYPPNYQLDPSMNSAMGTTVWNLLHKDNNVSIAKECDTIKSVLMNYVGVNNYCKTDDDCVRADDLDYFSCGIVLNKKSREKVTKKIAAYDELCVTGHSISCESPISAPKCNKYGKCGY